MNFKSILTGLLTIGVLMSVQESVQQSSAIATMPQARIDQGAIDKTAIPQGKPQVLLAQVPSTSSGWVEFGSRQAGFTALMPENSKVSDQLATAAKSWTVTGTDSDSYYSVSYFENGEPVRLTDADMDKLVNSFFNQDKFQNKFKEVNRSRFTIQGYSGRESSFSGSGVSGRVRVYAVKTRLYMTIVATRGANEKKISSFLDSFGLF